MAVTITKEEVRDLVERGAVLVDVLSPRAYEKIHIAGAINIPLLALDRDSAARLQSERPTVVYCHDYQ